MIKIKKGTEERVVTKGAFNSTYKRRGWKEAAIMDEIQFEDEFKIPDEDEDSPKLDEIPIGKMSLAQLTEYAYELGIDIPEEPTKKGLRALIKEYLEYGENQDHEVEEVEE